MRPFPNPDVRPLPWREAERKGVGGYPQPPTKEGSALSGLSRRTGSLRVARTTKYSGSARRPSHSRHPLASLAGAERIRVGGYPQPPTKEGSALSGLSRRTGSLRVARTTKYSGSARRPSHSRHPLASLAGAERIRVGGYPQPPTKEGCALSGLSRRTGSLRVARTTKYSGSARRPSHSRHPLASLAGAERIRVGGYPQPPTKEGCALSGLSRRTGSLRVARTTKYSGSARRPSHSRHPLASLAGAERIRVGGYPQPPTKEGCALSGLSRRREAEYDAIHKAGFLLQVDCPASPPTSSGNTARRTWGRMAVRPSRWPIGSLSGILGTPKGLAPLPGKEGTWGNLYKNTRRLLYDRQRRERHSRESGSPCGGRVAPAECHHLPPGFGGFQRGKPPLAGCLGEPPEEDPWAGGWEQEPSLTPSDVKGTACEAVTL